MLVPAERDEMCLRKMYPRVPVRVRVVARPQSTLETERK